MREIAEWLEGLGLSEVAETFRRNSIDARSLPELDGDDLREMGIPLGPRKLLLKAIGELRASDAREASADRSGRHGATPTVSATEAERRQLTVAFCDLVGSTELAARMDPEEYREILAGYRSAASTAIQKFDGHIASFMGDGILVYFGYPQAHEDDAERAVRAGLDIVDAIAGLQTGEDVALQVRIGIATGLVVAGDMVVEGASEANAVLGDTPNLAARLQGIAEPDTVVLSEATRRLVEGRVVLEALEPQRLKGLDGPVPAYRALSVGEESRFAAAAARGLTAMAGRESELMLLTQRWEQARRGEGQVVLLSGEPGIGKSRITEELRGRIGDAVSAVLRYQCSPYHGGSAFHPLIAQLQGAAGFQRDDSADIRRQKLEALTAPVLAEDRRAASLLAALLTLPRQFYPPLDMTPQKQKAETIGVLIRLLELEADRGPALMIFEDAHWIDPSSQEVLDALVSRVQPLHLLCLITCRPEFSPTWSGIGHITTLSLNRLGRRDVGRMVNSVTGGRTLPEPILAQILDRTDGVPLFVEELTKTVLEAGISREDEENRVFDDPQRPLSIPATLHDSLLARLDRLASVKEVAQTAACIGREFAPDLLAAVMPLARDELDAALAQLANAELVFRRGAGESAGYHFKHALVQDAAYESLLVRKRRDLHARIARALEAHFPETAKAEPERIAQHYTAAELAEKALPNWLEAGRRALAGSNLPEAITHLSKALELTSRIDEANDRAERELEVRTALGAATMALHGWPAPEIYGVVKPACDLFEKGHGQSGSFMNLWHLWVHHGCRAEHREGLAVVDRMLEHASERNDPVLSLIASFTAAMAHFWVGDYDRAVNHETVALKLYNFERDRILAWDYNHDPKCTLLSWSALRVWAQGYPERARALSDAAVEHAQAVGHPFNLCWTLGNSCLAYGHSGDYDTVHARIGELLRVARQQELGFMEAYMAPVVMCQCASRAGDYVTALSEGARAEEVWRSIGGRFFSPTIKAAMARACLGLDRPSEAATLIREAAAEMEATGELMLAEEVYRIAGLVQLEHAGDEEAAERFFTKSLDYAREHGNRSFELRTSMAMVGLLRRRGRSEEAPQRLAPVLGWFAEGHETADLRAAKALLSEVLCKPQ